MSGFASTGMSSVSSRPTGKSCHLAQPFTHREPDSGPWSVLPTTNEWQDEVMSDRLLALRAAVREGDDRATAALVLALQPLVWTFCSHVGHHGDEVALVEASFLDAFGGLRDGDPDDDDVTTWILHSAHNACVEAERVRERRLRRAARSPWGPPREAPAPLTPLARLPIERREVVVLSTEFDLDDRRIAQVIDASLATVHVRLAAARRDLAAMGAADVG
jgi:DNA-directed RNA polymerase specialized sigma24 family protein